MPHIELIRRRLIRAVRAHKGTVPNAPVKAGSQVPQGLVQRAQANPRSLQTTDLLYLQRAIGNSAVSRMLGKGGSGMKVGASDDRFEQEADRVSEQISGPGQSHGVQRSESEPEVGSEGGAISSDLAGRIKSAKGGGSPAPEGILRAMEDQTGSDFSDVRVHNDKEANSISSQLGAKAATYGKDIFLGRNQSQHDVQLMAHELTHTVQQGAVKPGDGIKNSAGMGQTAPSIQRDDENDLREKKGEYKKHRKEQLHLRARYKAWKMFDTLFTLPISALDHFTALPIHLVDGFNFMRTGKTWKRRLREGGHNEPVMDRATFRDDSKEIKTAQDIRRGGLTGIRSYLSGINYHTKNFSEKSGLFDKQNVLSGKLNPLMAWNKVGQRLKVGVNETRTKAGKKGKKDIRHEKKKLKEEIRTLKEKIRQTKQNKRNGTILEDGGNNVEPMDNNTNLGTNQEINDNQGLNDDEFVEVLVNNNVQDEGLEEI